MANQTFTFPATAFLINSYTAGFAGTVSWTQLTGAALSSDLVSPWTDEDDPDPGLPFIKQFIISATFPFNSYTYGIVLSNGRGFTSPFSGNAAEGQIRITADGQSFTFPTSTAAAEGNTNYLVGGVAGVADFTNHCFLLNGARRATGSLALELILWDGVGDNPFPSPADLPNIEYGSTAITGLEYGSTPPVKIDYGSTTIWP